GYGRIGAQQQAKIERLPEIIDVRDQHDKVRLSPDASLIGFGLEQFGRKPVSFSVKDRRLELGEARGDLATAETSGLAVTDWQSKYEPKLGGTPLKLEKYERSLSLAIASGQEAFLIGGDFHLRRFDAAGKESWSRAAPGTTWAVNLSRDGRLAVAAYGDGTI